MIDEFSPLPLHNRLLPELSDSDREQLQSAVGELFQHQAILRERSADRELYDWAREHFEWVREACELIGFIVFLNEDDQLIYALPGERSTLKSLKVEWTLVLLALWYDYDIQVRAEGPPVIFAVEAFNDSLKTKLGERIPSLSALREILAFFASRKLVRMDYAEEFHRSRIEVYPTIRFVLPFGEYEKVSAMLDDLLHGNEDPGEAEDA